MIDNTRVSSSRNSFVATWHKRCHEGGERGMESERERGRD